MHMSLKWYNNNFYFYCVALLKKNFFDDGDERRRQPRKSQRKRCKCSLSEFWWSFWASQAFVLMGPTPHANLYACKNKNIVIRHIFLLFLMHPALHCYFLFACMRAACYRHNHPCRLLSWVSSKDACLIFMLSTSLFDIFLNGDMLKRNWWRNYNKACCEQWSQDFYQHLTSYHFRMDLVLASLVQ